MDVSDSNKVQWSASQNSSAVTWVHKKEGYRNKRSIKGKVWKFMDLQPTTLQMEHLGLSKIVLGFSEYV